MTLRLIRFMALAAQEVFVIVILSYFCCQIMCLEILNDNRMDDWLVS